MVSVGFQWKVVGSQQAYSGVLLGTWQGVNASHQGEGPLLASSSRGVSGSRLGMSKSIYVTL